MDLSPSRVCEPSVSTRLAEIFDSLFWPLTAPPLPAAPPVALCTPFLHALAGWLFTLYVVLGGDRFLDFSGSCAFCLFYLVFCRCFWFFSFVTLPTPDIWPSSLAGSSCLELSTNWFWLLDPSARVASCWLALLLSWM